MLAYHNDPKIKQEILQQLQIHHDADEIIKGVYWETGKGCAVGCTLHSDNHQEYETRFGIPEILAHLEDAIFEGLPNDLAKTWPIRFMSAIPVGADLSYVWKEFAVWLLIDPIDGVIQYTTPGTDAHNAIIKVANLYQHGYTTQQMRAAYEAAANVVDAAANAAATARSAAAAAAAHAAANAAAAARSAAAAAHAAAYVVYAAAYAAYATRDARDAFCTKMSNKLIELLQNMDKTRIENVSLP